MEIELFDPHVANSFFTLFAEVQRDFQKVAESLESDQMRTEPKEHLESANNLLAQELERGFSKVFSKMKSFKFLNETKSSEIEVLFRVIELLYIRKNSRSCFREIAKETSLDLSRATQKFHCFLVKDDLECRETLIGLLKEGKTNEAQVERLINSIREYQLPSLSFSSSSQLNTRKFAQAFKEKMYSS